LSLNIVPGKTVKRKVTIRATRKAKGKVTITATSFKLMARSQIKVKPACKAKGKKGGNLCGNTNHL
jgi:tRNA/tmRNA/rRNA uracil-C5-methylase (TrmA/RlmC/RlmD family)